MKQHTIAILLIIVGLFLFPKVEAAISQTDTSYPPKPDYDPLAASQKGIQIFGTIVNGMNPNENVVLVKNLSSNQTSAKKPNMSLQLEDTYVITIVARDYIEVMIPGKRKIRLYKEGFVPTVKIKKMDEKKVPISITGSFKEEGFEREGTAMRMTEEYRKNMLEKDLPKIMMQAAAEPEVDANGNVLGFRLEDIENGSVYAKAGIQNGDVISAINGENLNSAQGAIKTLNSLRSASAVEFEVIRGGQKIPVTLEVR